MMNKEKLARQGITIYSEQLIYYINKRISVMGIINATLFQDDNNIKTRISPLNKVYLDTCGWHSHEKDGKFRFTVDLDNNYWTSLSLMCSGKAIEYISEYYNLSIDEAAEVLGAFIDIFDETKLTEEQSEILTKIKNNYSNIDQEYITKAQTKYQLIKERIIRLLELYMKNNHKIDEKEIANRLSLNSELIVKVIEELDSNMQEKLFYYRNKNYDLNTHLPVKDLFNKFALELNNDNYSDLPF